MAFDGSGNFVRIHNWTQDAANGLDINAGEMDGEDNGFAAGLTLCVTRDGQGKMAADFLPGAAGTYNLGSAGAAWLNVTAKSAAFGPPSSGNALALTGLANAFTQLLQGSATAGQSFGLSIHAGTSAADIAFAVANQAASLNYFQVLGDGGIVVGNPTGGDPGIGGINIQGPLQLAGDPIYAGIPQNSQSGAYQLVLTDANKHIYKPSGNATITVPANATVPFPIRSAVTIVNDGSGPCSIAITTDTLVQSPGGATGPRTLAQFGVATLLKVAATRWFISGTGLS